MSLTNCYATLEQLRPQMRINNVGDTTDDVRLELALSAASRQIDAHCGRRFWQDSEVKVREYIADDSDCLFVDDISTTTGLIVKVDTDLDGTFEDTLTISTDFLLFPRNADKDYPVRPWDEIRIRPLSNYFFAQDDDMPTVQVTARFGWSAIPDDVEKACLVQAGQLFKSDDAAFGAVQYGEAGVAMRVQARLHPIAEALLEPYLKPRVG